MALQADTLAPDFILPDDKGAQRTLSEFRGKPVLLYFYPKDDTPGCTTEACSFRDDYRAYCDKGVVILGVSPDTSRSHAKFKAKYTLPFPLLADETHQVSELYGAWGRKKFMGKEYNGVLRTTFLIGPDGTILRTWEGVKPDGHSAEILAALEEAN